MGYQNENECLYEILGVRPDCTLRQIRVAYKKLALANHPDRFRTAAEKEKAHEVFARINNAHQILSDPKKREKYNIAKRKFRGDSNKSSTYPNSSGASSRHEKPRSSHHHNSYSSQSSTGFSGEEKQNQENRREPRNKKHQKTRNHYSSTSSSARQETKGCNTSESSSSNRSSSHSGDNSSTNRSWEDHQDYGHRSQRQKVYGKCQDGRPCLRCISQQKFCYQHCNQDPDQSRGSSPTPPGREERSGYYGNQNDSSHNTNSDTPIYGVNMNGQPCKRCIKKGDFCYQHETQRHKGSAPPKQNDRPKGSPGPSTSCGSGPFGVTKNGEPCKRCIKQCSFCYQHKYQEHCQQE